MKALKKRGITLSKVISIYRKRGMSKTEATKQAKIYMLGYTAAKKGSVLKRQRNGLKEISMEE